jgi:glutamate carboxypeptidase
LFTERLSRVKISPTGKEEKDQLYKNFLSTGYPAMPPTPGNLSLLSELNQVSLDLGQGEVVAYDPGKRGAADISFVARYLDGLDGLGVMGSNAHAPGETVDLRTLEDIVKRTALLLYRLTGQE